MKLLLSPDRGRYFKEVKVDTIFPAGEITVGNSIVLTGSNGSGKSTILNSLALAGGLGDRYSSKKSTYSYSHIDLDEAREKYRGLSIMDGEKEITFPLVLRYRADETRMMPLAMDLDEDLYQLFDGRGSHGETNLKRLGRIAKQVKDNLSGEKATTLLLLDEPEAGLSLDIIRIIGRQLTKLSIIAGQEESHLKLIVATQHPSILRDCLLGFSQRIDLGGWFGGKDPFEEEHIQKRRGEEECKIL